MESKAGFFSIAQVCPIGKGNYTDPFPSLLGMGLEPSKKATCSEYLVVKSYSSQIYFGIVINQYYNQYKDPFATNHCNLGGGFNYFLLSPLLGEDSQFDSYFSNGLVQPPTSNGIPSGRGLNSIRDFKVLARFGACGHIPCYILIWGTWVCDESGVCGWSPWSWV